MRGMLVRVLTGLVLIPIAVFLIFARGGLPFAIAIGVVSIIGAFEFYGGARKVGIRPVEWAGVLAIALLVVSARTYERSTIGSIFPAVMTLLLIFSFVVEMHRRKRSPLINVGTTVLGAIYVGWLTSHLVALRNHPGTVTVGPYTNEAGAWLVLLAFLCTWACDTGAYFIGRSYGKTKLAANLSPNKTVEGAAGGFVGSILISLIAGFVINLPWYHAGIIGAMSGILSQVGDLSESTIKRELGIKDFGRIVPGHGGVLDRFDSMLFTGPMVYYYVLIFLQNWPS